jgi:hypothetical protein
VGEEEVEAVEAVLLHHREAPERYVAVDSRRTFADIESRRLRRPSDGSLSSSTVTDASRATDL